MEGIAATVAVVSRRCVRGDAAVRDRHVGGLIVVFVGAAVNSEVRVAA
jgi:hypothetical protein